MVCGENKGEIIGDVACVWITKFVPHDCCSVYIMLNGCL